MFTVHYRRGEWGSLPNLASFNTLRKAQTFLAKVIKAGGEGYIS